MNTEIPQDILNKVKSLKSEGFEIFPHDRLEEGLYGLLALKSNEYGGFIEETFSWHMFDEPIDYNDEKEVSVSELIEFIQETPDNVYSCDNPKRLEIGFIRYFLTEKRSERRWIHVRLLKTAFDEDKTKFMDLRDKYLEVANKYRDARSNQASAI